MALLPAPGYDIIKGRIYMRRSLFIVSLLFVSFYCFAQQNLPGRIIGKIPDKNSAKKYEIQVGAFTSERNAQQALLQLRRNALNPVSEQYLRYTRVMIKDISANQVAHYLVILKKAGFNEVVIRENRGIDTPEIAEVIIPENTIIPIIEEEPEIDALGSEDTVLSITEKWEIDSPDSVFASFEFTQENRFIAVERGTNKAYFGEYTMPAPDIIIMNGLGTLHINKRNNDGISISFSQLNEPSKAENISAVMEKPMARDRGTDLFSRAWRITNRSAGLITKDGVRSEDTIGRVYLYSINGTYLVTKADGSVAYISHWGWDGDSRTVFLYSHDNWQTSQRTRITIINENSLMFNEGTGSFVEFVPAYDK